MQPQKRRLQQKVGYHWPSVRNGLRHSSGIAMRILKLLTAIDLKVFRVSKSHRLASGIHFRTQKTNGFPIYFYLSSSNMVTACHRRGFHRVTVDVCREGLV